MSSGQYSWKSQYSPLGQYSSESQYSFEGYTLRFLCFCLGLKLSLSKMDFDETTELQLSDMHKSI